MIGKTISHYSIIEKLGEGGMGEVYRARDTRLDRDVALKVLRPDLAADPEYRARFEREAKAIAALNHPNIVHIHSVEEADGVAFFTMEFVEGRTLSDLLKSGGLPLERFFGIAIPLADAMSSAHGKGITHRDLKPSNIMLDRSGRAKILDFGLAKLTSPVIGGEATTASLDESITAKGHVVGTVAYMSPEQVEGKAVDPRSDIFSLGVILYEMTTGERPFKGDTPISTLSSILRDTPPAVNEIKGVLPRHLGRIVCRCLEKDPDRRYQSVLDLRNDLQGLEQEIDSGELVPQGASGALDQEQASAARHAGHGRRWLWALGVLAVAAAITFWPRARSGPERPVAAAGTPAAPERDIDAVRPARTTIVVLPFENLGSPDDAYFAAGMTEEITSRLAVVGDLGVISRTSATQYDRTGKTVRQIGDDLGADYLLEGTIRWDRSGDRPRIRVTPQLIRVADDTQVWSERYDRILEDIFTIQAEIADRTIRQLGIALQEPERKALEQKPTDNLLAYDIYLRGLAHAHRPSSRKEDHLNAARLFEQAVELDPGFALAYARLSTVHSELVFWGFDSSEQRIAQAKAAADRALQLQPNLPEAHRALGAYYYDCFFDYDHALKEFAIAAKGLPNDPEILEMIAYIWRRQGLVDDAIVNLHRAADLDPRNAWLKMQLGFCYECTKRYAEADRYLDASITLDPDQTHVYFFKSLNHLLWDGDLAKARATVAAAPKQDDPIVAAAGWMVDMAMERYQDALDLASALPEGMTGGKPVVVRDLMVGCAQQELGHDEQARAAFESARTGLEKLVVEKPTLAEAYTQLGLVYAHLGRMEEAIRSSRHGVDLVKDDAVRLAQCRVDLIKTLILAGEHEAALDLIEQELAQRWTILSPNLLRVGHAYVPLRNNPRFQHMIAAV